MVDGMLWQHAGEAPMMRLVIRNLVVEAGVHVDNAELLKELRIERHQREDQGRNPGRWLWIGGAAVVLLLLLGGVARLFFGQHAITVQTATAVAPSAGGEAGAVLQATGYVTARRRATVSAQITGTLTAVLIEEGDRVTKGQVLARFAEGTPQAELAQFRANLVEAEAAASDAAANAQRARSQETTGA
jgi:multidrug efflux pump subunit AcrA (membrane-fusion protein)